MTTISVDVIVNQTQERFRNELLRAYASVGDVAQYAITSTELTGNQALTIDVQRLLVLVFTGQLLIQLQDSVGASFPLSAKDGTLVLPFRGRVVCTPAGTATNPRVVKHVAI